MVKDAIISFIPIAFLAKLAVKGIVHKLTQGHGCQIACLLCHSLTLKPVIDVAAKQWQAIVVGYLVDSGNMTGANGTIKLLSREDGCETTGCKKGLVPIFNWIIRGRSQDSNSCNGPKGPGASFKFRDLNLSAVTDKARRIVLTSHAARV